MTAGAPKVAYTDEQRRAIETRRWSVHLSAGAGCGKTFVLTERFLDYFKPDRSEALDPDQLGELIAITFTERAAREMRDRIRRACADQLRSTRGPQARHWGALLRALDNARISTIHSFCAALLRSHAVEAGVDPQFQVLEQAQAEALLSEAIDDCLREAITRREAQAIDLAVRFDLEPLHQMLRILVQACGQRELVAWRDRDLGEQLAAWVDYQRQRVLPFIGRALLESSAVQRLRGAMRGEAPSNATMQARLAALQETLTSIEGVSPTRQRIEPMLKKILSNARVEHSGGAKAWADNRRYESFKDAAGRLRELINNYLLPIVTCDPTAAEEAARVGRQLCGAAERVAQRYAARKRELAAMDFADLLRMAAQLLTDPDHASLRAQLSAHLRLLLVDEFQDTDPLQVDLLTALCGNSLAEGRLFLVGDSKQSIYRFRGADPHVFRHLRSQTPAGGRLSLTKNFRSQPAILEFVNALFWHALGDEYEPLRPRRAQLAPLPAIEFLWSAPPGEPNENEDVNSQRRREAEWIARRIRQILDGKEPMVCDRGAASSADLRPAQPGDIAILFRALPDVELYEEALRRYDIDYYLVGGRAFYAQQEVFDLLNLLRALHDPDDLVSLVGALRSGFFALADETIFWLSRHPGGLAEGVMSESTPREIPSSERQRVRRAAAVIQSLRQVKDRLPVDQLIEQALELTGYDAVLVNEFLGERKLANLRKLVEQARSFKRGGFLGLADFIVQLADFVSRQPDEALAATHSENNNVVRLMTVHQAKGLEFPIVVVADLDRPRMDRPPPIHFHAELGPLVRLKEERDAKTPIGGYELWRLVERLEETQESHRLLYVATTRAADYLMLSSGVARLGEARGPWMQLLAQRFDLLSGRVIGDLPTDEPRPTIRVTTSEPDVRPSAGSRRPLVDWEQVADVLGDATSGQAALERAVKPVPPDASARWRFSFSRLDGRVHARHDPALHDDSEDRPIDPRGLGTLAHSVLAAIDLSQAVDCRQLVSWHADRHVPGDLAAIDEVTPMIERFLASPRATQLKKATTSYAEIEFLLRWPLGAATSCSVELSGWIDRLWQDSDGRWHVLDFKTNRVAAGKIAEAAAPYEMQMLLYALATEELMGSAPVTLTLHFLRTGAEHEFAWNKAARQRAIELVERGIAAAKVATAAYES